jgi:parallel beta-helix repeat protein
MFTKIVRNAFLPAAAAFFCMNASAATPVTQCGQKLDVAGEEYVFTGSLNCTAAPVPTIFIQADKISVDMKGFQYTGNGVAAAFISAGTAGCMAVKNVELMNGSIMRAGRAIGVCVPGSKAVDTNWYIHDMQIRGSGGGVILINANGNKVINVAMERLTLVNPNPGSVKFGMGIEMTNSSENRIHNNSINVATEEGIKMVFNSQDNEVKGNQISNTKIGVLAGAGVKENVIRGNKSLFNTVDMQDDNFNPACGTDVWVRNVFTVASQFCIQ